MNINNSTAPLFLRITNNTVVNVSHILSIDREYTTNVDYTEYNTALQELMKDVIKQYTIEHPESLDNDNSPDDISRDLYEKFYPVVKKNIDIEYGGQPEPFIEEYKLTLINGQEYRITSDVFKQFCAITGVDMSEDFEICD